jgi:hypothetical protein
MDQLGSGGLSRHFSIVRIGDVTRARDGVLFEREGAKKKYRRGESNPGLVQIARWQAPMNTTSPQRSDEIVTTAIF